jgi:hypothetical protein
MRSFVYDTAQIAALIASSSGNTGVVELLACSSLYLRMKSFLVIHTQCLVSIAI